MKTTKKFACFVPAVLVFLLLSATAACAASFTFSNDLDIRMSITMTYVDADSGAMTTRGWWHVEPGGETVITVNADESSGVYYAAYNKGQYYDSGTRENPQIMRWASPRTFTYTTDEQPYGDGVWHGTYYRINGRSVRIDTSEALRGSARENTVRVETASPSRSTRPSSVSTTPTGGAQDRETLGNRLSTSYLSREELAACSKETLAYLRNRIYANHGYSFRTRQWSEVFSRYDWYMPNPNFSEGLFNEYERENLRRIMDEEKR